MPLVSWGRTYQPSEFKAELMWNALRVHRTAESDVNAISSTPRLAKGVERMEWK